MSKTIKTIKTIKTSKTQYAVGQTVTLAGAELAGLANHPCWMPKGANPLLAKSIKHQGVMVAGAVTPDGIIQAGHGRRALAVKAKIPMRFEIVPADSKIFFSNGFEVSATKESCYGTARTLFALKTPQKEVSELMLGDLNSAFSKVVEAGKAFEGYRNIISRMHTAYKAGKKQFIEPKAKVKPRVKPEAEAEAEAEAEPTGVGVIRILEAIAGRCPRAEKWLTAVKTAGGRNVVVDTEVATLLAPFLK